MSCSLESSPDPVPRFNRSKCERRDQCRKCLHRHRSSVVVPFHWIGYRCVAPSAHPAHSTTTLFLNRTGVLGGGSGMGGTGCGRGRRRRSIDGIDSRRRCRRCGRQCHRNLCRGRTPQWCPRCHRRDNIQPHFHAEHGWNREQCHRGDCQERRGQAFIKEYRPTV